MTKLEYVEALAQAEKDYKNKVQEIKAKYRVQRLQTLQGEQDFTPNLAYCRPKPKRPQDYLHG